MKEICAKADIGYSTYRNWKSGKGALSDASAEKIYNAMLGVADEIKEFKNRKTTLELLNEVVAMGFDKELALESIDRCLDEEFGFENRKELNEEILSDELYNDILLGFKCELETKE